MSIASDLHQTNCIHLDTSCAHSSSDLSSCCRSGSGLHADYFLAHETRRATQCTCKHLGDSQLAIGSRIIWDGQFCKPTMLLLALADPDTELCIGVVVLCWVIADNCL